ncbi:MAG: hypothetical protein ACOC1U_06935 [Spirochaetota bacterium]
MMRGEGSYYTPIAANGQVVEKHVESIQVSREDARPRVTVSYSLTNPYDHPIVVPIQSGLTLLYEFQQQGADRKPELHVVPATVTRHANGELLYVADEAGTVFGTTAIQRQHLGTGIPNYRHPVAISITLVPGDVIELEASASIPPQVEKMILVDAMVGPEQPYGIYPQLLEHPSSEGRVPPPLRVYKGASFQPDPPYVRMPTLKPEDRPAVRLPRWISSVQFARLQAALRHVGRMWAYAVTATAVILGVSLVVRLLLAGMADRIMLDLVRTLAFAALGVYTIRGSGAARIAFTALLAASGVLGLVQVASAIVSGPLPPLVLLTQAAIIPILFVACALALVSPSVRAHTRGSAGGHSHERRLSDRRRKTDE